MSRASADVVLGINAFHGDSAAALLVGGHLVAAIEEERLTRVKHWAGFPKRAIGTVLGEAGLALPDVGHVAVSRDPGAHLLSRVLHAVRRLRAGDQLRSRIRNHGRIRNLEALLREQVAGGRDFAGEIHHVEHHHAHLASAFFCSPFEEAACLTVDGFGDFLSSMSAIGRGRRLEVIDSVAFPHSLGLAYTAVTQFLGFEGYGDEYKVMGLAAHGQPTQLEAMRSLMRPTPHGRFENDLECLVHASEGVTMSWDEGEPHIGRLWSPALVERLGPARAPDAPVEDRHRDLAASLQAAYEEAFFHRLRWLQDKTGLTDLCLAGGCAQNSVANGKIFTQTPFTRVFVQPAAGDAGTALGAAQYVWHEERGQPRAFVLAQSCWGPAFAETRILAALAARLPGFDPARGFAGDLTVRRAHDEQDLVEDTAQALSEGRIVGWFQGRSEWGPRALGHRSILADPRRAEMRDVLNAKIKRRESFRPFAPSILEERVGDYFAQTQPDPFMTMVYPVRPERRAEIPAVTHVDGTGRLQTVSRDRQPRYWALIQAFERRTGVPVLLNTSFNESEPIVNTPEEALDCFLRTGMDRLVLGEWIVDRPAGASSR